MNFSKAWQNADGFNTPLAMQARVTDPEPEAASKFNDLNQVGADIDGPVEIVGEWGAGGVPDNAPSWMTFASVHHVQSGLTSKCQMIRRRADGGEIAMRNYTGLAWSDWRLVDANNFSARDDFVAAIASGLTFEDGQIVTSGGLRYRFDSMAGDPISDLPGLVPVDARVCHFGAVVNDPTVAEGNVSAINDAEDWAAQAGGDLLYPAGVVFCEGRVIWRDRVRRRGMGTQPNWRPAPVTVGASTPVEQFTNEVGCELRFIGAGTKDLTFPWVTNGRQCGFGRPNPRRAYTNAYDVRLDLRDFSNQDADEESPATLRQLSAAVVIQTNTLNRIYSEGITIRTACDGVSVDGGTGLEGYEATDDLPAWADYDIGLLVDSPWRGEFYRLSVLGYWNEAGVLWSASRNAPEFEDDGEAFRGYAEGNVWRNCIVQSGWVYRTADSWPILDKDEVADTITILWTPSHQFAVSGTFRIGESFTDWEEYSYDGVTYDDSGADPVLVLQITSSVEDIEVGNNGHAIFFSGGAGPATSAVYDSEFYDLSPTSLLHEPAYNRPYKAGCEISGNVSRAIRFHNTVMHSHGFMPIAVGYAPDLQLSDCYIEPRQFRLTHGGDLQDRGGLFICGPDDDKLALLGSRHNGSIYARGYFQWPGLNMAPLIRVSATGWFGGLDGDWFNPRSYSPPLEQNSRTNRIVGLEGLRGNEVRIVARGDEGEYLAGLVVRGSTGTTLVGLIEVTDGEEDPDLKTQLVMPVASAAVLRNDLHLSDSVSTSLKDFRNDQNGGLASQDAPTADGFRFIASSSQLRIRRSSGAALQLHRGNDGATLEFRRAGVVTGQIELYSGLTRYAVTSAGLWMGMPFTTAGRPSAPFAGFHGFDTTLGIPVWWTGSNWVNASGATV